MVTPSYSVSAARLGRFYLWLGVLWLIVSQPFVIYFGGRDWALLPATGWVPVAIGLYFLLLAHRARIPVPRVNLDHAFSPLFLLVTLSIFWFVILPATSHIICRLEAEVLSGGQPDRYEIVSRASPMFFSCEINARD